MDSPILNSKFSQIFRPIKMVYLDWKQSRVIAYDSTENSDEFGNRFGENI
jgi:hypothetical protein